MYGDEDFIFKNLIFLVPFYLLKYGKFTESNYIHFQVLAYLPLKMEQKKKLKECYINLIIYLLELFFGIPKTRNEKDKGFRELFFKFFVKFLAE